MKKVEYDREGYPIHEEEIIPIVEDFTEEDRAFLEELREMMEEFK